MKTNQITSDQAIFFAKNKLYEDLSSKEIVDFQLFQDCLAMPWGVFHEAMEKELKRPVFTHEFAYLDHLRKEYLGERPAPTFEDIMNLIPESKRMVFKLEQ